MKEEKRKVPKRRLQENSLPWKHKRMNDILEVHSGRDYKHLQGGTIPVYGTGGYMLSVNDKLSEVDGIGIGRKGTIDKPQYLEAPFWTVDTLFYMIPKKNIDIYFIYTKSKSIKWKNLDESTGVPSLSKHTIDDIEIYIPEFSEQQKIGEFFKVLDERIANQERKIAKLKALKEAYLTEMFPQEGEAVPKRRFKEFEGNWSRYTFSDILKTHAFKPYLAQPNVTGTYYVIQQGDKPVIGYSSQHPFYNYENTVLFGDHTLSLFKPEHPFLIATDGVKILEIKNMPGKFLYILLQRYLPRSQGYKRHYTILLNKYCYIPRDIKEQQKIGDFFKNLDDQIATEEKKLEKLTSTKTAYLEEMFV